MRITRYHNYMTTTDNRYTHVAQIKPRPMSRKKQGWLNIAMKTAESSECVQKHGAVIVKSGSLLSVGHNKWKNREVVFDSRSYDERNEEISVHAEIDALSRVKNPVGATIYIANINKSGEPKMSAPCDRCFEALMDAGIKDIIYTTS